jgi:hypothetical protein
MLGRVCAIGLIVAALALPGSGTGATAVRPPTVTVIGDSVLTAVIWNNEPLSIIEQGLDVRMEVGVCRTLTGVSCPFEGQVVPSVLDVVHALGTALGPTVLVEGGYNDPPKTFKASVEDCVDALIDAGVRRILWATLREWQVQYPGMNRDLVAVSREQHELTLVDWESYSHDNYSWFQGDGVHLTYQGAIAMATLFNQAIREALAPPLEIRPAELPPARVGRPYETWLIPQGGVGPYRFTAAGPLPAGLHLLATGRIYGEPRHAGRTQLTFRARDSYGIIAVHRVRLTIVEA